jgi:hypothetical protein
MRRISTVLAAVLAGVLSAGLATAVAAPSITVEETIVFGEHTVKARNLDLAGEPDDFKPGDRYIFRSELSDPDGVVGHLYTDCSVQFAKRDSCSAIYDVPARGTIVAEGLVPVAELVVGGTWTFAVTGGTGDFENVRGSVTVEIVDDTGNSEHTLHLLP